ncbi:MmgE/PrpD family protein [Rhodococcus pyridinivorans]|uniref:MmgE/PrpD family protein n=1 Tax=Rhodococcus pyridinivorans TaxID=103816 RepID=UPI002284C3F3|nr:MmgE/PrpD family protein [Rhodococcus pyridinivorans]WAL47232.1 MmgE/PrpD family protein [Rhodococcus pyridinivorans]
MNLARTLASHAIEATPDAAFESPHDRYLLDRVVDTLGCMIAGTRVDSTRRAAALVTRNSAPGRSSVALEEGKVGPASAAYANALLARAYDFGPLTPFDGASPIWSHISETTVPVAVALAEDCGASARTMLEALIVADDVAARISRALEFVPGTGWDNPGLINRFASAVVAARLWNLSADELVRAWGLVLQQVSGTFQAIDEHSDAFTFVQGLAARDGIEAADPGTVREITLTVHPHHIGSPLDLPVEDAEVSRPAALFGFQFQTANALVRGRPVPAHFDDPFRNDPEVLRLAHLVRLRPAAESSFPLTAAHLEIRADDGRTHADRIDHPWGDPRGVPAGRADVDAKFVANLRHAGLGDSADASLSRVRAILASNDRIDLSALFGPGAP